MFILRGHFFSDWFFYALFMFSYLCVYFGIVFLPSPLRPPPRLHGTQKINRLFGVICGGCMGPDFVQHGGHNMAEPDLISVIFLA